jgi:light-regulated signal transduction histidine kinase (bacteriophytochrome)
MMIEALHFRDEQIGYVLLEKGPEEGNVYELLRGQIASALKGAFILQAQKQAEDELREHRDHLDDLVRERTAELAASNAQLRQEVTVRRQAEVKLEGYTAELERSNRELQAFAYVASHDLQEPLRKIQTFGDRLQQKYGPNLDERGLNYLDRMQNAAARMQALIIDLLSFSRVRTHTEPFQQVDLQQVVTHVLQDLEIFVADVKAEIEVAKLPVLEADPSQMRQLFQNLLGNALKFHRQGVAPRIKIHCQTVGPECEMMVVDNGIGFDERYAERIFNVFERLNGREEYAGTGVGLAICRRIVERHNGTIYAQSKSGEGSRFIVRLPLRQAETETADKEGAAQ